MNLILKIAAGVVLAVILLTVGCSALVASSTDDLESLSSGSVLADAATSDATGDGTYIVGEDVQPGTYRLPASGESCYWARLNDVDGGLNSIITNNITEGPSVIHIAATDYAVEFSGCDTSNVLG